jgi:hypothetical protein
MTAPCIPPRPLPRLVRSARRAVLAELPKPPVTQWTLPICAPPPPPQQSPPPLARPDHRVLHRSRRGRRQRRRGRHRAGVRRGRRAFPRAELELQRAASSGPLTVLLGRMLGLGLATGEAERIGRRLGG